MKIAKDHYLPVGSLQKLLDGYTAVHPGCEVDYIHGKSELEKLCINKDAVGFIFDGIEKEDLFDLVDRYGPLPKKTFSMGTAYEKRYYLEARKI